MIRADGVRTRTGCCLFFFHSATEKIGNNTDSNSCASSSLSSLSNFFRGAACYAPLTGFSSGSVERASLCTAIHTGCSVPLLFLLRSSPRELSQVEPSLLATTSFEEGDFTSSMQQLLIFFGFANLHLPTYFSADRDQRQEGAFLYDRATSYLLLQPAPQ